jgi:hypothetical protein
MEKLKISLSFLRWWLPRLFKKNGHPPGRKMTELNRAEGPG